MQNRLFLAALIAVCATLALSNVPTNVPDAERGIFQDEKTTKTAEVAKEDDETDEVKEVEKLDWSELELKTLFPEKRLWGPSARGVAFSFDGKYASYTYRPYVERRHGSDLWIYVSASGETKRITSVSMMAEFQESVRKVKDDRIEKARKKDKEKAKKEKKEGDESTEGEDGAKKKERTAKKAKKEQAEEEGKKEKEKEKEYTGNEVDEDDAEADDAPRYSGISSVVWSPVANELLFSAGRDIYRYVVETEELTRLTQTSQGERAVKYLPDGSGYTFLRDEALLRVTFGSHLIEQLDPRLPGGEEMSGYRMSPDGKRLTFLARKNGPEPEQRTVNIARYRDRFMDVREVPRTVSDDQVREVTTSVYVYELKDRFTESGVLTRVYTGKTSGPRDFVKVPEWAPDSSRVCFAAFDAEDGQMQILEAVFPIEEEVAADGDADDATDEKKDEKKGGDDTKKKEKKKAKDDKDFEVKDADVAYRFLHTGGPNTPSMIHPYYLADSRRPGASRSIRSTSPKTTRSSS